MVQKKKESFGVELTVLFLCVLIAAGVYIFVQKNSSPDTSAANQTGNSSQITTQTPTVSSFQRILISSVGNLSEQTYGYVITNGQVVCETKLCGGNTPMPSANVSTFAFLYTSNSTVEEPPYTADQNNVYCDGKVLAGADPASFEPQTATWSGRLGDYSSRTAKDASRSYVNCTITQ